MSLRSIVHDHPRPKNGHAIRWLKRAVLVAAAAVTVALIVRAWLPKPVQVDVAMSRRTTLLVEIDEEGKTRVRDRFVVSAPIAGNLDRIELDPGAIVAAGAAIARISPPDPALMDPRTRAEAQARLAAAIARERRAATAVIRATAARDSASRDAARARTLDAHGAIAAAEREHAELSEHLASVDLTAAQAERAAAGAEVAMAKAVLGTPARSGDRTEAVTAPIAGQVLRVLRDSAGPVFAGAPLLELGDPRSIEVVVDVLSSDAARIALGMPVTITGWGGDQRLYGQVRRVEPSAFTQLSALGIEEQRVNVIVAVDNPPPSLGDGFRIEAQIVVWHGDRVLTLPASALFRNHDRWAVFAIENGRARLRPIEIGHRGRLDVEIVSGLDEGSRIIVHPSDRVSDGIRVQPRG